MKLPFNLLPATCLLILSPALMMANIYTFVTPGGSTQESHPVSAQADFTTGNGTIDIILSNLLSAADMVSVAQNISDLKFTMDNTLTSGSETATADFVNVAKGGASTAAGSGDVGWVLKNTGPGAFWLDGLDGAATDNPAHTIIGGSAGDAYTNANGSIAGNGPHNPFVENTAHFVLTITGVTADTVITSATFSFGTQSGNDIPGEPLTPIPEPGYALLLLGGMLALFVYRKKFGTV